MKLSSALQYALGAMLVTSSCGLRNNKQSTAEINNNEKRQLQNHEPILSYNPMTQVTDAAAIDLDQIALESMLNAQTQQGVQGGLAIYSNGAFSKSYAILNLDEPLDPSMDISLPKGTPVVGQAVAGSEARGHLMETVTAGATTILVEYETGDEQRTYLGCQAGGNPDPNYDGCFATLGTLTVGNSDDLLNLNIAYSYDPFKDNKNGRTLQSFSTNAKAAMYDCANCPYETYQKFYNYYNTFDYGNQWVLAAFNGGATNFGNGNADFSSYGADMDGALESIEKGTVFLNVFMEVVKSMEIALDDCNAGCDIGGCNGENANSWDEAVAYYVGSMTKVTGGDGPFLYTNAQKQCRKFGTCSADSGDAAANAAIIDLFKQGQEYVVGQQCSEARLVKDRIIEQMVAPMIQGTLRFAYLMDKDAVADPRADATGATYAASILPFVHSCSPVDAQIIYSNMRVGKTIPPNFTDVKAAFERTYTCMGLSCDDVGGLLGDGGFLADAAPCNNPDISDGTNTGGSFETGTFTTEEPMSDFGANTTAEVVDTEETDLGLEVGGVDTSTATPTQASTDLSVQSTETESTCPPCAFSPDDSDVAVTKSTWECRELLAIESASIARNCNCACFVDFKFAFCAQRDFLYSGSGEVVGPCEVNLSSGGSETAAPTSEVDPVGAFGLNATSGSEGNFGAEAEVDGTNDDEENDDVGPSVNLLQSQNSISGATTVFFAGTYAVLLVSFGALL